MRVNETLRIICTKFCMLVGIPDVIIYANFGIDQLMHFFAGGDQILPFPLTLIVVLMDAHRRLPPTQLGGWKTDRQPPWTAARTQSFYRKVSNSITDINRRASQEKRHATKQKGWANW